MASSNSIVEDRESQLVGLRTNDKIPSSKRSSSPIKGSSRHTSEFRSLQLFMDRKQAPAFPKDALKFDRGDYQDAFIFSEIPSPGPTMTSEPTKQPSKTPSAVPSISPTHNPTPSPSEEPTFEPTRQPSAEPSLYPTTTYRPTVNDTFIPGQLVVGAYYYPWHADDFHRGDGYLREHLTPSQLPDLGEYDDREDHVLHMHLRWSRQANINLWITSWWRPDGRTDNTLRTHVLQHDKLQNHQIAIFYETQARIRKSENYTLQRVATDMQHLCEHYLDHPNYYTLEDSVSGARPVLFVYLTRSLAKQGVFEEAIDLMRQSIRDACGKEVYLIGDQVFGKASNKEFDTNPLHYVPLQKLDAVTNYDVYGSMGQVNGGRGGILSKTQVRNYYEVEQAMWKEQAEKHNCQYVPSVSAGYNDLGVRPENKNRPLSRTLVGMGQGSLLEESLKRAIPLADVSNLASRTVETHRLLVVNSFNEWHEDTQIEPTKGVATSLPINYTYGLLYEGYGDRYLEILRKGTEAEIDGLLD
ncbi:unnamed protein product [Cylindrotheca closterium]|uniref:Uncharacterized protein n=1 Tax=Cylindrotheca closterium TaxID=2856 RepID=A0AAD2CN58_9STRA|nr:unnamed protein product [Cylindrotheca closterium]